MDRLRRIYAYHNCTLLVNACHRFTIRDTTVTGLDDKIEGRADILKAVSCYGPSDLHIAITHCPQFCKVITELTPRDIPIDLMLSGHTHGGHGAAAGFYSLSAAGTGKFVKGWFKVGPGEAPRLPGYRYEHGSVPVLGHGRGGGVLPEAPPPCLDGHKTSRDAIHRVSTTFRKS